MEFVKLQKEKFKTQNLKIYKNCETLIKLNQKKLNLKKKCSKENQHIYFEKTFFKKFF